MKIQYLAVIFIIIIMPIIIVFSEYLNTQMTMIKTEQGYDFEVYVWNWNQYILTNINIEGVK